MSKDRLLLLLNHRENRRLLIEYLSPKYEIVLPRENNPDLTVLTEHAFDLAIFDLGELGKWRSKLSLWRQKAEPPFLPMLALMPKGAIGTLPLEIRRHIDELVSTPIDPIELDICISVLLRARHLSLELNLQNQKLEEMNTLKSRFVSVVSHEFRNPLSVISGMVQLLHTNERSYSLEKKEQIFQRIEGIVNKLTSLLDNLLILNRNASPQAVFKPQATNVERYCKILLNEFKLSTNANRSIELHIQGDLSSIQIDVSLVDTILTNLLSNACKYSPPETPVVLSVEHQPKHVVFRVQDQGQGIPPEDHSALFEAFFRARNVGKIAGTGLGLSIVKQCVDLHCGTIEVISQVHEGTTFVVTLPSMVSTKGRGGI